MQKGLILIEAIVAIAFAGFTVLGLTTLFTSANDAYLHSRNYTQALYLAESKIEESSLYSYSQLTSNYSNTTSIYHIEYKWERKIKTTQPDSLLHGIEVIISWSEPDGRHQARLITEGILKP